MADAPPLQLLVADDDAGIRDMLARALRADFHVTAARDGTEALALLQTTAPDALLVDERMPGASGSEVLRAAKERFPDAPRILMTASPDPTAAMAAVNLGEIHRFYTKPLRLADVRAALLDLVTRARAEVVIRAELATLRTARSTVLTTRVLVCADGDGGDRVVGACVRRGFQVQRVTRLFELEARIGAGHVDVVVVSAALGDQALRTIARLVGAVDEATALVVIGDAVDDDGVASAATAALQLSFELGASDCFVAPLPEERSLSSRLERAAARPREKRELRRLTYELVVANGALALERQRVEDGQVKLLNGLIRSLEARDEYTAGHTDRVAALALRAAEELGLSAAQLRAVRLGALLHDVGKIGIRDEVLYKPGRLTPDEFDIIKTHTTVGARILDGIDSLACAVPIVRGHHEKLGGGGYPDGLAGDAIAMEVRVVAVADVLDAITSTRPYRPASSAEQAFEIMAPMVGPHLDPVVVDVMRALHRTGRLADLLLQR